MHSTKLALRSCLYFKVERNRESRGTSQADQARAVTPILVPWLLLFHTQDEAQTWQGCPH